jgi:hypothetical protein
MKTTEVDMRTLRNMVRIKNQKGKPYCWVCGEDYYSDLFDEANGEELFISYMGTRTLLNIPIAVVEDHPKLKNNEIILLNETEYLYVKKEMESENGLY